MESAQLMDCELSPVATYRQVLGKFRQAFVACGVRVSISPYHL